MRIVILSILFFSAFYYLSSGKEEVSEVDSDNIKVKASAPERPERLLTLSQKEKALPVASDAAEVEVVSDEEETSEVGEAEEDVEEVEHTEDQAMSEMEKSWQDQLQTALFALEPENGQEIFEAYLKEKESFQTQLDSMIRKNQKNQEIDGLIEDLENRHEEKIREIFGTHYEEIKEQQGKFMERMPALAIQNQ